MHRQGVCLGALGNTGAQFLLCGELLIESVMRCNRVELELCLCVCVCVCVCVEALESS